MKFFVLTFCSLVLFASELSAQTFSAAKYYQLRDGNEWRYAAPPTWKEGDYISRMIAGEELDLKFEMQSEKAKTVKHFDATKAAKVLALISRKGLYYLGEEFAGGESYVVFDAPILWFPAKFEIGQSTAHKSDFTRFFKTGKTARGTFEIKQKIAALEDVTATAGTFKKCLRVESETFWELGDGRKARSINVYHYAKNVGVVKASARFIVLNADDKELINRLVETDLKAATVNGKQITNGKRKTENKK